VHTQTVVLLHGLGDSGSYFDVLVVGAVSHPASLASIGVDVEVINARYIFSIESHYKERYRVVFE
jgi:hypothetical protein